MQRDEILLETNNPNFIYCGWQLFGTKSHDVQLQIVSK